MDAKLTAKIGLVAVAALLSPPVHAEDSLLPNGGMEVWQAVPVRGFSPDSDGVFPAGCTVKQDNPPDAGTGVVSQDSEVKNSGASSLRLESREESQSLTVSFDPVQITPGQNYVLSGYLRGENLSEPINKETGILVFFNQGPSSDFTAGMKLGSHRVPLFGTFDWEPFEISFTAEPDADSLRIAVQSRKMQGVLWIDDIKLVAQP
jgi:hypothetical protein